MKVKTVKCKEGQKQKCPVCGEIFPLDKPLKPCRHVLAWHNTIIGDWAYIQAPVKKTIERLYRGTDVAQADALARLFGADKNVIMILFDEGYVGGDEYSKNLVAFEKEKTDMRWVMEV